jgi:putative transposase
LRSPLMRRRRWLAPPDQPAAVYHCVSRVVDRRFVFGEAEKHVFQRLMLELAEFCQVRILTYCLMSNHFHILVEVPRPPDPRPSAEQTLEALARLGGAGDATRLRRHLDALRGSGDPNAEARWLAGVHARRWNLSRFLQALKQRFSRAYNLRMGRKGTLWEERFRSVLVQGEGRALVTMAAYIDLNPVRAGLVEDPKEYRWSGYAAAVAGVDGARAGVERIVRTLERRPGEVEAEPALGSYRSHLFVEGNRGVQGPGDRGIGREAMLEVLAKKGRLTSAEYLRCRVRYFSDGAVLGSRDYVEGEFRRSRDRFGPKRRSGAREMKGLDEGGLYTVRALRVGVFG